MRKVVYSILIIGLSFISFSQVNGVNSTNKVKEPRIKESRAIPLSESKSSPTARGNQKSKIKQVSRKENYEIVPQKD